MSHKCATSYLYRDLALLHAVLQIDLALRFHGNSTTHYQLTEELTSTGSVHVSVYFRPESNTGVLLSSMDATLFISNGSISWSDGMSVVQTPQTILSPMQWYHVLASR